LQVSCRIWKLDWKIDLGREEEEDEEEEEEEEEEMGRCLWILAF